MGGPGKLAKRKERGQLNAQERLDALVDQGQLHRAWPAWRVQLSMPMPPTRRATARSPASPSIDGRDVGVVVNEFTTKGASTSATNSKKMGYIRKVCTERGLPFVHVGESTGARLPDAMGSKGMGNLLGNDITQFRRMRDTPWVAAALDTSFGSSAWLCCCADFAVMKKGSIMSVSSPRLVSMAIGEKVDLEELGRLAAACRADRADRSVRRHRRRGHGGDAALPVLHAEPQRRIAAGRAGAGRLG